MNLGLGLDWASADMVLPMDKIALAERLGFDSVWAAEAYGSDALTPLAYIAAHTKKIRLGTSVAQLAARTPANAAMSWNTLDALAGGGRAILGLGLSGPQIVEGWYGRPWQKPTAVLRDYVEIVKKVWQRKEPVRHSGEAIQLPYCGADGKGMGKPLKSIMHTNADIPIWLGTGHPSTVTLTAEIADGWLPFGFTPGSMKRFGPWLEEGFARAPKEKSIKNFHIQASCHCILNDDVPAVLQDLKRFYAFYVGGMGHKEMNFHKEMMKRRGYAQEAERIQELFMAGKRDEATEAVPDEYVDEAALIGPVQRIAERFRLWRDSGAHGLTLHGVDERGMRAVSKLM